MFRRRREGVGPLPGTCKWGAIPLAGMLAAGLASPAQAELRPEQILGLGIQLLDQAQRGQGQPAPRQPAVQQQAPRQPAARQTAPAARAQPTQPAQVRRPRIPRSDAVAEAQRYLNALGYDAGDVDGQAGPQTRRAIASFQRDQGLAQTGEADAGLLSALRGRVAAPAAGGLAAPPQATGLFGGAPTPAAGEMAAAATLAGGFQTLPGIDLPGGDYRSGLTDPRLAGTGVEGCAQLCAGDDLCQGFTYNTRADICILKDRVLRQDRYADAVSGIRGGGGGAMAPTPAAAAGTAAAALALPPGAPPTYADFVHMALMSDTEAYAAEAGELGIQYLAAIGTNDQCKEIHAAQQADEFTRRDFNERAAAAFRDTLATLADRPRRVETPIEQTVFLSEYDFDRQGFALPPGNSSSTPLLTPGVVRLMEDGKDRLYCRASSYGELADLGAEHGGAPGIDFLPMSQEDARAFRANGGNSVVIRATLVVEPRDQGRGPLKGQVTAVSAHDPASGRLLHRWDLPATDAAAAAQGAGAEWSGALVASLVAPALEPFIDDDALERAAVAYFSTHANAIETGNPPPGSPLPVAAMRGQPPELIVSRHRDRLREVLREPGPALPLTVQVEQRVTPWFEDGVGLQFNAIETGIMTDGVEDPLSQIELSDRDLHLHEALLPPSRGRNREQGFKAMATTYQAQRIRMETDRILRLDSIPATIEEAAARNLVGNRSIGERDAVILRWTLDLTEVRATEGEAILSAAIKGLTYHWASDGTLLHEAAAEDFPTVAALRGEADAALGPVASADNILTPPDGTRWGVEMTDLLRLRHAPETVDDKTVERMMITRYNYEARIREGEPLWGRFFRDVEGYLTPEDRRARLAEFRTWSEARAAALPQRLTLRVRLYDGPGGKVSPFLPTGIQLYQCRGKAEADPAGLTELQLAEAKLCGFLEAARTTPDPLFALPDGCEDDPYCQALNNARSELKIANQSLEPELVRLDRLPLFDDAARAETGERALEVEVEVTGGAAQATRPLTVWQEALARAQPFAETYSLQIADPQVDEPAAPVTVFEATALAARLIDRETGTPVRDLLLGEPAPPSDEMLAMPESKVAGHDILGIRLGMSFDEADRLIREHMEVGKVLTADRSKQLSAATGKIVAYSSGRIYASATGDELIGILDEPPAAPASVVGVWRILRLPVSSTDPVALKATLVGRYGEPRKVEEVSLPYMQTGIAWSWLDVANDRCVAIQYADQADLWRDETGSTDWLPAFMSQPYYPILHYPSGFEGVTDQPLPPANFCPAFLGVRFATHDGSNRGEAAADEIVTWLSDNRAYAKLFYESLNTPTVTAAPEAGGGVQIKF